MNRKLSMLLAAIAVSAFGAPAVASANTPTLWDHSGKVAIGATFLATSMNFTNHTSFGLLKCNTVSFTGMVTHNAGGTVRGVGQGTGTSSVCTVNGNPISLTDLTVAEIHTAKAGSGMMTLTFVTDFPGGIVCHFRAAGVPFTYAAGLTNDTIQITNGNLVGTPAACEPGLISGTFTLETEHPTGTGAVWIQ